MQCLIKIYRAIGLGKKGRLNRTAKKRKECTWYIFGNFGTSGLCSTLNVKLTICKSLLPVVVEIFLGLVRTS